MIGEMLKVVLQNLEGDLTKLTPEQLLYKLDTTRHHLRGILAVTALRGEIDRMAHEHKSERKKK